MKDETQIRNEILDKIEKYAGKIEGTPAVNMPERLDQIRAIALSHFDMLYAEGHIDSKPGVYVEWHPNTGFLELYISWPVSCIEMTVNYGHNEGFKEVNE